MSRERAPIIPPPQSSPEAPPSSGNTGLFQDDSQSSKSKTYQLLFVALVVVMVLITIALSIYRAMDVEDNGFMYFLLGVNLIGFCILEILMIVFVRRGQLPQGKTWFLYFVGGAVLLESIFTNVALFH